MLPRGSPGCPVLVVSWPIASPYGGSFFSSPRVEQEAAHCAASLAVGETGAAEPLTDRHCQVDRLLLEEVELYWLTQ